MSDPATSAIFDAVNPTRLNLATVDAELAYVTDQPHLVAAVEALKASLATVIASLLVEQRRVELRLSILRDVLRVLSTKIGVDFGDAVSAAAQVRQPKE